LLVIRLTELNFILLSHKPFRHNFDVDPALQVKLDSFPRSCAARICHLVQRINLAFVLVPVTVGGGDRSPIPGAFLVQFGIDCFKCVSQLQNYFVDFLLGRRGESLDHRVDPGL
jgi:hypothetical protein